MKLSDYGVVAHEKIHLPAPECLMVKELVPGTLGTIAGTICYDKYETLT